MDTNPGLAPRMACGDAGNFARPASRFLHGKNKFAERLIAAGTAQRRTVWFSWSDYHLGVYQIGDVYARC
jgi:hypothetical protein